MFNILKHRKTKEDREKELKKLEKKTIKKIKKQKKEEERLSDEHKKLLKETRLLTLIYLTFLCVFFILNLYAGIIFAVVSAPFVYLYLRKKYSKHAMLFPVFALCVTTSFLSIKGGDVLNEYLKKKNLERQKAYNENLKDQLEHTQKFLDFVYELYELQDDTGESAE